jgi:hypothetical protein
LVAGQIEEPLSFEQPCMNKYTTKENKYASGPASQVFRAARDEFEHFSGRLRLVGNKRESGSIIRLNGEIDESIFVCAWVRAVVAASCGFHRGNPSWIALSRGAARTWNARPALAIHATAASAAGNKN